MYCLWQRIQSSKKITFSLYIYIYIYIYICVCVCVCVLCVCVCVWVKRQIFPSVDSVKHKKLNRHIMSIILLFEGCICALLWLHRALFFCKTLFFFAILYHYIYIGMMVRVFTNGLGDLGSIPDRVIPKT